MRCTQRSREIVCVVWARDLRTVTAEAVYQCQAGVCRKFCPIFLGVYIPVGNSVVIFWVYIYP